MKIFPTLLFLVVLTGKLYSQSLKHTEDSLQNYFTTHKDSLDPIEGLWEINSTQEYYSYDTLYDVKNNYDPEKVVIIKKQDKCQTYDLKGLSYNVEFIPTDVKSVYLYRNFFPRTNEYSNTQAIISKRGQMEYTYDYPEEALRIKLGDSYKEGMRIVNILRWKKIF